MCFEHVQINAFFCVFTFFEDEALTGAGFLALWTVVILVWGMGGFEGDEVQP